MTRDQQQAFINNLIPHFTVDYNNTYEQYLISLSINNSPIISFDQIIEYENKNHDEECPICYEIMKKKTTSICCHSFHKVCISKWLNESDSCPICRLSNPFA